MKFIFRVDASTDMGIGHLMRCLTLAEMLHARGAKTRFICREHSGNLIPLLQKKRISVVTLPMRARDDAKHSQDYALWLGVTQGQDARESIEALNGEKPDWLIVDHYGLDVQWEREMRPFVDKLMVIDDLANRNHDCDVLLDQNYAVHAEHRYHGFVPEFCRLLVGPRYALLGPEYARHRNIPRTRNGEVGKVLVFFGGSDPFNMTGLALDVLSRPEFRHIDVDVVIGANNQYRSQIDKQVEKRPRTTISGPRPHLADLMVQADVALGAGGATTWERMCLGLPAVVISIAENQRPGSDALANAKLIQYVGYCTDIGLDDLMQVFMELIGDDEKLVELGLQSQRLVDGAGALRVVETLIPSAVSEVLIRRARAEDIVLYYNWANDPEVRKNAFNADPISWRVHQQWFSKRICDADTYLFVIEVAGLPVGQIRFEREGDEMNIDYSLDVIVRGRGWGKQLVALGICSMAQIESIRFRAVVKCENQASRSVFLRMGFTETVSVSGAEVIYYLDPVEQTKLVE